MKDAKGPAPAHDCPNCHGTGVDLGDMAGLARVVQACHCVKGGTFDERELWAVRQVLAWRQENSDRARRDRLSRERCYLLGKSPPTAEQTERLQVVTAELTPLLERVGLTVEEQDMNRRMMEYVRSRLGGTGDSA